MAINKQSSWKKCPSCRGSRKCLNCGGSGTVSTGVLRGRCAGCGGNGTCSYCKGRGEVAT